MSGFIMALSATIAVISVKYFNVPQEIAIEAVLFVVGALVVVGIAEWVKS